MSVLALILLSNQFWYGFFIGAMISLVLMIFIVALLKLRRQTSR